MSIQLYDIFDTYFNNFTKYKVDIIKKIKLNEMSINFFFSINLKNIQLLEHIYPIIRYDLNHLDYNSHDISEKVDLILNKYYMRLIYDNKLEIFRNMVFDYKNILIECYLLLTNGHRIYCPTHENRFKFLAGQIHFQQIFFGNISENFENLLTNSLIGKRLDKIV